MLLRSLDRAADAAPLAAIVAAFRQAGRYDAAKEGLLKLGDVPGLLALYVGAQRWDDAFLLLAAHGQLKDSVFLPYARWLLEQDRCVRATACMCASWHSARSRGRA